MTTPSSDDNEFEHIQDLIEEGEVPFMSFRVVAVFSQDGTPAWHGRVEGENRIVPLLGYIELFKQWVLKDLTFGED